MPGEADQYDEWGVGYSNVPYQGGTYPEATELPLAELSTMEDVASYPWPSPDDYDYSGISAACDEIADYAICLGGPALPDILNGVSRGRGMEQVMIDIMTGDEVGVAIIDRRVDHYYEYCRRGLEAAEGKIDILCIGEDCGNQRGRMFPPRVFLIILPVWAPTLSTCRAPTLPVDCPVSRTPVVMGPRRLAAVPILHRR